MTQETHTMKRLHKITLKPRASDALYTMQGYALYISTKKQCDVEFTFKGSLYRVIWAELSNTCAKV